MTLTCQNYRIERVLTYTNVNESLTLIISTHRQWQWQSLSWLCEASADTQSDVTCRTRVSADVHEAV